MLCSSIVSGLDSRSYSVAGLKVFEALAIAVGDDSSMKSSGFSSDYSGSILRFFVSIFGISATFSLY